MRKVLITGTTGYLGSHIAEVLINQEDIQVIGFRRENSSIWRCEGVADKIRWIVLDKDKNWIEELVSLEPDTIVHCAWIGVESDERSSWKIQRQNFEFILDLMSICDRINLSKFVFLGSQAEYGNVSQRISESAHVQPNNAYAYVKLSCLEILKYKAELYNFDWVWLRVFSVFGGREGDSWLLPSLIKNMKSGKEMDLTLGEQKYAYLYIDDFAKILLNIILITIDSGVYNISSNFTISIRELIEKVRNNVNPDFKLNFGKLPYREGQSMHIEGNVEKLENQIGALELSDFDVSLQKIILNYLNN